MNNVILLLLCRIEEILVLVTKSLATVPDFASGTHFPTELSPPMVKYGGMFSVDD